MGHHITPDLCVCVYVTKIQYLHNFLSNTVCKSNIYKNGETSRAHMSQIYTEFVCNYFVPTKLNKNNNCSNGCAGLEIYTTEKWTLGTT